MRSRHHFFVMRHGISEANAQSLIVSAPDVGCSRYGLTAEGRVEIRAKVGEYVARLQAAAIDRPISILTSDFRRTLETAEMIGEELQLPVATEVGLRERFFGRFDLGSSQYYQQVWDLDHNDPSHQEWEVESVVEVASRMRRVVERLEKDQVPRLYLLVSHGDPLHILQTCLLGNQLSTHRSLPNFAPGELRELKIG